MNICPSSPDHLDRNLSSESCLMWLESPGSEPVVIGKGATIVIAGFTAKAHTRVRSMQLVFDEHRSGNLHPVTIPFGFARDDLGGDDSALRVALHDIPDGAERENLQHAAMESGGFWLAYPLQHSGHYSYRIQATYTDGTSIKSMPLSINATSGYQSHFADDVDQVKQQIASSLHDRNADTVICLASYQPDSTRILRQIRSIQQQHYRGWVCLICDDGSKPHTLEGVRKICQEDPRFILATHAENVGFYRNFERALHYVPSSASFIALSDQDDDWFADKLESLVENLTQPVGAANDNTARMMLAYSDMRVVDEDGNVISETYWSGRRNNHSDADIVLLANTVTGAASLIRQELLSVALPFPDPIGDAFHDHWLACCALSYGPMGYIDRPLYDYYQYDDSVIGHCDFTATAATRSLSKRMKGLGRTLALLARPLDFVHRIKRGLVRYRASGLAIHHQECRRLELVTATLKLRVQQPTISAQGAWRLFGQSTWSGIRLLIKHLSVRFRGQTTNHAEIRLGSGYLIDSLDRLRLRIKRVLKARKST